MKFLEDALRFINAQKFEKAERCLEKFVRARPNDANGYNLIGYVRYQVGNLDGALSAFIKTTEIDPGNPDFHVNCGNVFRALGRQLNALASYEKAIDLNSRHSFAHSNRGIILAELRRFDEALESLDKAIFLDPSDAISIYNKALSLYGMKRLEQALESFDRSIVLKPGFAEALNNRGVTLQELGRLDESLVSLDKAIALRPDYAEAFSNRGITLYKLRLVDEALKSCDKAIALKPDYAEAFYNRANTLKDLRRLDEAICAYERALALKPDYVAAEAQMLHQQHYICDFTIANKLADASTRLGIATAAVPPFAALSWSDHPERQMLRSKKWAAEEFKQTPLNLPARPKIFPDRLKIGYFSGNFHNHAVLFLMIGLLREHDKNNFEVFAYSYGRTKSGDLRKKAEEYVEHFFDVTDQSDQEIADLARSHGLDIAIDLMGYTADTRSNIFEYRLAPVQINYLGYPGSMGVDFIDYIIADPVVIPPEQRAFYSEKVIYLPHTYQPNDDAREIAETATTRSEFGLPQDAFVFCCFNSSYKITPDEFEIWMSLLRRLDRSVLWLLKSNKWAEQNLRKEAELRGIDPARLVFAEMQPHTKHLARHRHADLFIDTFNYNAHTTASDALWGGLPVVTKKGKQFAARVAASLLTSVGLPELITETNKDYENLI